MNDHSGEIRALFLSPDGNVYPDTLICSGILPAELGGKICPFSDNGRFPLLELLDPNKPGYSIDKGKPGDLCPPCAKQQLGSLSHWQGHGGHEFRPDLLPLRLFKCRMWLWFVVTGIYDDSPTVLKEVEQDLHSLKNV
jgi:hypothetical protein